MYRDCIGYFYTLFEDVSNETYPESKTKTKKQNEWLFGIISWNIRKCFGTKTEIKMKLHPENGFGYEKAESKKKTTIDWTALL